MLGITFVILMILTTIRGGTYGDYKSYERVYGYVRTDVFWSKSNFYFEPLYSILQWLCKRVFNNFIFFVFVIGVIVISLEFLYAKKFMQENEPKESYTFTILFIFWGLYYCNIFVIRSTIAMMICMYSVQYIQSGNTKKFLKSILIAAGFHYSALVFLPAYFIYNYRSSLKRKLLILFTGMFVLRACIVSVTLFVGKILGGTTGKKLLTYASVDESKISTAYFGTTYDLLFLIVKAIANIAALLLMTIYLWRYYKKDKRYEGYFNLYCTGCILYVGALNVGYAFARLSIYYNVFQIPLLTYFFCKKRKNRLAYWIIIVTYIGVRYFVNLNGGAMVPFVTYWK